MTRPATPPPDPMDIITKTIEDQTKRIAELEAAAHAAREALGLANLLDCTVRCGRLNKQSGIIVRCAAHEAIWQSVVHLNTVLGGEAGT